MAVVDEGVHIPPGTLGVNLDAPVGQVANPAADAEALGLDAGGHTEADALDAPADEQPLRDPVVHRAHAVMTTGATCRRMYALTVSVISRTASVVMSNDAIPSTVWTGTNSW